MQFVIQITLLLFFIQEINSQNCNGTNFFSQLLSPSANIGSGSPCSSVRSNSCCPLVYFSTLQTSFQTMKQQLTTNFNHITSVYNSKLLALLQYSKTYDITYYFQQALNWTLIDPSSNYINQDYLNQVPNIFTEFNNNFQVVTGSFQICAQTLLNHYSGFSCGQCDPNFYNLGFWLDNSNILQLNIDFQSCSKLMYNCYPYILSRSYFSNLINVFEVMNAIFQNITIFKNYMNNMTDSSTRFAFSNSLRNVTLDFFEYPEGCNNPYNCSWICYNMITPTGINMTALLNPTTRLNYSIDSFRRLSTEMGAYKSQKQEQQGQQEQQEQQGQQDLQEESSPRNLQTTPLPTNILFQSPSGILFTTTGWRTVSNGTTSGLDPTLTLQQYIYSVDCIHLVVNILLVFLSVIYAVFI